MTNSERDTLLINLATSVNNLQQSFNDFRVENREEHKRIENTLRAEMKQTASDLRAEMKQSEERVKSELRAEMKQSASDLRAEIKQTAEKTTKELKDYISYDDTGITEMFRDVWSREATRDKRLDSHDEEIRKIKAKLA